MLIKHITKVPQDLFDAAFKEIISIDWNLINDARAKRSIAFSSSKSLHLRIHKQPPVLHENIHDWGKIVETDNHPRHYSMMPATINLAQWAMRSVNGLCLGRVFITHLESDSIIHPHIDTGTYFTVHSRYHIPFITTDRCFFINSIDQQNGDHMIVQNLYQLNNSDVHGVKNNGPKRVHLIIDIKLSESNTPENFKSSLAY